MSNETERIKGKAAEIKGAVMERVGNLIDNEQLRAAGHAKKIKGQSRQGVAKATARIKGLGQQAVGQAKSAVGDLIGNEQLKAEGTVETLKGKSRQKANR